MSEDNKLITVEGIEGAGKTTTCQYIVECLLASGLEAIATREPGGTSLGDEIRHILLDSSYITPCDQAELLLMFASRAQHLHDIIWPALQAHQWVVCDRFTDASYAYQGGGRGIAQQRIHQLEQWLQGDFTPGLVIIMDIEPKVGMQRVRATGTKPDRIEQQTLDFFERVRDVYLQRANEKPERYRVIDANRTLEQVKVDIDEILTKHCRLNHASF
jgi:dTMP kinase